jgi:hypothetical protein
VTKEKEEEEEEEEVKERRWEQDRRWNKRAADLTENKGRLGTGRTGG